MRKVLGIVNRFSSKVRFDPTVSLSSLLTLVVAIVSLTLAYATLDKRLAILEHIVAQHDAHIAAELQEHAHPGGVK